MLGFHQLAAAIYLAAGLGALLGVVLPAPRMLRGATWGLLLGALVHGLAIATLHRLDPPPSLTDLPTAVSFTAGIAVIFLLVLMRRLRVASLTAVAGPVAFLAVFIGALRLPHASESSFGAGSWPHAHVLLSSAGLALLGVAGLAGLFFLIEHRRLKRKRPMGRESKLPSLEALDRINVAALAVGFPLLTLGVVTGIFWVHEALGRVWTGADHESWLAIAWAIYAGLVLARFVGHQGSRQAAASALAGFAFLLFAVVGVGLLA
jgi:ABC-type transport system involved in cytochrome c biogenesis permease subunit